MQKLMKSFYKSSLLTSILLLVVGILLLFKSNDTIMALSYILGCILIVLGIIAIVNFFRESSMNAFNDLNIVYGIVTIILGVLIITSPTAIATFIPFVVGLGILISSSIKLAYSIELKNEEDDLWRSTLIMSAIGALCGVLILFNPFKTSVIVFKIIGLFIIIYAVLDIISILQIRKDFKKVKEVVKEINNSPMDAEIIEEKEVEEKEQPQDTEKKKKASTKRNNKKKQEKEKSE